MIKVIVFRNVIALCKTDCVSGYEHVYELNATKF